MAYKGNGTEFSIRVPDDIWEKVEKVFVDRDQPHLSKNDKVLTLMRQALSKYQAKKGNIDVEKQA